MSHYPQTLLQAKVRINIGKVAASVQDQGPHNLSLEAVWGNG